MWATKANVGCRCSRCQSLCQSREVQTGDWRKRLLWVFGNILSVISMNGKDVFLFVGGDENLFQKVSKNKLHVRSDGCVTDQVCQVLVSVGTAYTFFKHCTLGASLQRRTRRTLLPPWLVLPPCSYGWFFFSSPVPCGWLFLSFLPCGFPPSLVVGSSPPFLLLVPFSPSSFSFKYFSFFVFLESRNKSKRKRIKSFGA